MVLAFVPVLSGIDVLEAVLEGAVDHQGQFAGGGGDGFGGPECGLRAAQVGTECGLGTVQSLSRHPQRGGGAVGAGAGATALAATGRFAVVRTESQPTGEVFFRGPAGHVQTDRPEDRQSRVGVDAIDPREIDARLVFEQRLGVERDAAFAVRLLACGRQVGAGARGGAGWSASDCRCSSIRASHSATRRGIIR